MRIFISLALILVPVKLYAQPAPASVSGSITSGAAITLTGTAFSTKSPAAPTLFDDAEGSDLSVLWDDWAPTATSSCNIDYFTPAEISGGMALPYATGNTQYISGCHQTPANSGNQVWVIKDLGSPTYPFFSRKIYKWRADSRWSNANGGSPDDNNWKMETYGESLLSTNYQYYEYSNRPASAATTNISQDNSDSGSNGYRCDSAPVGACHSTVDTVGYSVGDSGLPREPNPINNWINVKHLSYFTAETDGFIMRWENELLRFHTIGPTDAEAGTTRQESFGSYARSRSDENRRYFDDIYYDVGPDAQAFIEICSGSTAATRTYCEPQIPTSWSSTSIGFTARVGALIDGTNYLYVTDRTGLVNSNGLAVTVGGGSVGAGGFFMRKKG